MERDETLNLACTRLTPRSLYERWRGACPRRGHETLASEENARDRSEARHGDADRSSVGVHDTWYAAIHGRAHGPMTLTELVDLVSQGHLSERNYIWRTGLPEWLPMRRFRTLLRLVNVERPKSAPVVRHPKLRLVTSEMSVPGVIAAS